MLFFGKNIRHKHIQVGILSVNGIERKTKAVHIFVKEFRRLY